MSRFKFWEKLPGFHKKVEREAAAKIKAREKEDYSGIVKFEPPRYDLFDINASTYGDWKNETIEKAYRDTMLYGYYPQAIAPLLIPVLEPIKEEFATKEEEWGF